MIYCGVAEGAKLSAQNLRHECLPPLVVWVVLRHWRRRRRRNHWHGGESMASCAALNHCVTIDRPKIA